MCLASMLPCGAAGTDPGTIGINAAMSKSFTNAHNLINPGDPNLNLAGSSGGRTGQVFMRLQF